MRYLTNTFSPLMLGVGMAASIIPITLEQAVWLAECTTSAISHEVTAKILSTLLGQDIKFNRLSLTLEAGDEVIVVTPKFRAEVAREFTKEEVESAGFGAYRVFVRRTH